MTDYPHSPHSATVIPKIFWQNVSAGNISAFYGCMRFFFVHFFCLLYGWAYRRCGMDIVILMGCITFRYRSESGWWCQVFAIFTQHWPHISIVSFLICSIGMFLELGSNATNLKQQQQKQRWQQHWCIDTSHMAMHWQCLVFWWNWSSRSFIFLCHRFAFPVC